jgi:rod shape determining protein RodA
MSKSRGITLSFDPVLTAAFLVLIVMAWFIQYSATGAEELKMILNFQDAQFLRHTIWLIFSAFLFVGLQYVPGKIWGTMSWYIYAFFILLLIAVLVIGSDVKGAQSWLHFAGFSIQPAEMAKISTFLALSTFMGNVGANVKSTSDRFYANIIVAIPLGLILLQPDAGSALVFLSSFLVLYREGFSSIPLYISILAIIIFILTIAFSVWLSFIVLLILLNSYLIYILRNSRDLFTVYTVLTISSLIASYYGYEKHMSIIHSLVAIILVFWVLYSQKEILKTLFSMLTFSFFSGVALSINYVFLNFLQPHQQERIFVWLDPSKGDPQGSLYNLLQSKMAIGSGHLLGKGYLSGNMTKLGYIPEQRTDFIFSTIAEQFGFLGSCFVVGIFTIMILRLIFLAEKQKSGFSRIFMLCVACCLFTHLFINLGMTIGLVPVIGIPLPFLSYGGSALLSFTFMLGVVHALDDSKE